MTPNWAELSRPGGRALAQRKDDLVLGRTKCWRDFDTVKLPWTGENERLEMLLSESGAVLLEELWSSGSLAYELVGPWAACWKFFFPWAVSIRWKTPTDLAGIIHLRKVILREAHSFVERLARSPGNAQVSVLACYFCWAEFVLCLTQWQCTPRLELAPSVWV